MKSTIRFVFYVIVSVAAISCNSKKHFDESVETMNKGEISIYADEAYQVIVGELIQSYENVYPEAKIRVTFASEKNVVDAMTSGNIRMIITGKELSDVEKQSISRVNEMPPRISMVAHEAIAIITSIHSPDSIFDFDTFLTTRNNQSEVNSVSNKYVFMKGQTSFVNAMTKGTTLNFEDMFSLESSDSLIHYISKTDNSYGFISFALLSDIDDPKVQEILKKVKILPVVMSDIEGVKKTFELSQSTIATSEYPLLRNIYVIRGNMAQSLGTGFVNFMYRSKASRIFLKAGLIPEVMPERELLITE